MPVLGGGVMKINYSITFVIESIVLVILGLGISALIYSNIKLSERANKIEDFLESCQANNLACAIALDKCTKDLALGYDALQSLRTEEAEISKGFKWASYPNSCNQCTLKKNVLKKELVVAVTDCQIGEEGMRCPCCGAFHIIPDHGCPFDCSCGVHGRIWGNALVVGGDK
jgi:hypothetical protein